MNGVQHFTTSRGDERDEGRERLEMSQEEVRIEAFDEPM